MLLVGVRRDYQIPFAKGKKKGGKIQLRNFGLGVVLRGKPTNTWKQVP